MENNTEPQARQNTRRLAHPRLGVVTVTYNSQSVFPEFLDSVLRQTYPDFILYIVDNASTDGTQRSIAEIADARVRVHCSPENLGFAAGTNLGMKMALEEGCDTLMLLNNDTVFGPEMFQQLVDGLDQYDCDMTTPKMLYYEPPNKIWAAGGRLNKWLGYRNQHDGENQLDDGRFDSPRKITFTPFCCIVMRRSVVEKLGYLDERYFVYTEDADYCFRAMQSRLSIWYVPQAKLWHKVSSLTGHMSDFMVRYCTRNRIYFLRKLLSDFQAKSWYGIYHIHYAVAFLSGKNSHDRWRLRRTSAGEGWRMQPATRHRKE